MTGSGSRACADGLGLKDIGLVFFDANLIDAGDGGPEAFELLHFARVVLHADHLHDDLKAGFFAVLHFGEAHEVCPDAFKFCAFAVLFEGFLGCAVEAEGDVGQRRVQQFLGGGFVEKNAVGGEQR